MMMDRFDCMKFVVINGKAVQVVIWNGNEVPDGLIPLDGRIVNGITLPDHRDKVLYTKSEDSDEAIVILRECIMRRDLLEVMNDRVF
jgi:hypothetical protein